MAKGTSGGTGAFTYDFGIMISQATVGKLERVAKSTLTLAGAYYALNKQATEYVSTLRKQQMYFGGQIATMKAIADAQKRVIDGAARFDVTDQLEGMNNLMRVGIDARKEFEFTEKAAHAMGVSYSQFANAVAQGVSGNMGGLIEMGLLTERSARMFEKYGANTVMRQQAILNFVKTHKGLQSAIANDFGNIQDQMLRLTRVWKGFVQAVLGSPADPNSLYGQVRFALESIADGFKRNFKVIERYAYEIGQVLGWIIRQIGELTHWLGGVVKNALQTLWKVGDDYVEQTRSVLVWLEFWKVAIVDFFKKYENTIKSIIKWFLIFAVAKKALMITDAIIRSVYAYGAAFVRTIKLQRRYLQMMGPEIGRSFGGWMSSLAVWMPRSFRRIWVNISRQMGMFFHGGLSSGIKYAGKLFVGLGRVIVGVFRAIGVAFTTSNPVGWIILAVTALIALVVLLYKKCEPFRKFVNNLGKMIVQYYRLIWNGLMWVYVQGRILLQKVWKRLKTAWANIKKALKSLGSWIAGLWDKFMNTKVGAWLNKNIIQPIVTVVKWVVDIFKKIFGWISKGVETLGKWFGKAADKVGESAATAAAEHGISVPVWNDPFAPKPAAATVPTSSATTPEPEVTASFPMTGGSSYSGGSSQATSMSFSNGAIQIILNGSTGIDENKLAQKVKEVIVDLERDGKVRGGRV